MSITTFDTLKFAKQLKSAGFTDEQAEAQAEAMRVAFSEALDKQVATKADITVLQSDIANVRSELKADITVLKWMIGLVFAAVVIPLIKSFLG